MAFYTYSHSKLQLINLFPPCQKSLSKMLQIGFPCSGFEGGGGTGQQAKVDKHEHQVGALRKAIDSARFAGIAHSTFQMEVALAMAVVVKTVLGSHFGGVGAPIILVGILVGIEMFTGG